MVIMWLMMVNDNLVGGAITILKNDGIRQWVSDDIPYMKWKKSIHVPNHQPGVVDSIFYKIQKKMSSYFATDFLNYCG